MGTRSGCGLILGLGGVHLGPLASALTRGAAPALCSWVPSPQLPSHGLLRPPSCLADGDIGVRLGRRGGYQAGCGQFWHETEGQLSQQLAYLGVEEGNGAQCGKGSSDPLLPDLCPKLSTTHPNQLGGLASWVCSCSAVTLNHLKLIFGCDGSLLPCGPFSGCSAQSSRCSGFLPRGVRALGRAWASAVVAPGL